MKKKKQLKPLTRLIGGILLSLIVPWCFLCKIFIENSVPWWVLGVISGVLIIICVCSFIKEKKSDKKFHDALDDYYDDSYFSSSEWRERYLEYIQEHTFETPKARGMKADLKARYRKMTSVFICFLGIFMFFAAAFLYYCFRNDDDLNQYPIFAEIFTYTLPLIAVILGVVLINAYFKKLRVPVKEFYQYMEDYADTEEIENEYANGKILSSKYNGINIGTKYTIVYDPIEIYIIPNNKINTIARYIVRLKKYSYDITYQSEKYIHKLYIRTGGSQYYVELNEFQVEMALEELSRFAKYRGKTSVIEETI